VSIINNISNFILSKKESPKLTKQFFSWNQISSVLIVAYDNQLSDSVDFINTCKNDNIKVHVAVIYNGKPEQAPKPHFEHTILDKRQFSFFKIPIESALQKLNAMNFDVLINLGNNEQLQALALSKLLPVKCKISNFKNDIFDITIDGDTIMSSSNYLKQVVVYLNMIKTK
jgi:hypothetical protein